MSLALYRKKRNFKNTAEPTGKGGVKKAKLRFVVQRHHASRLHYDFRIELGGVLKSWAVPKGPSMSVDDKRLAILVEDHPVDYGKFYGEIPEGNYGAGIVEIWDKGTYRPLIQEKGVDPEKLLLSQFKTGDIKLHLTGKHLKGGFALVRIKDESGRNWLLIKKKDDHAVSKYDIVKTAPVKAYIKKKKSVKS